MADIKTKATAKKVSRGGANTLSLNKPSTDDNGSVVLPKAESVSQVRADFNSFVNDELKKKYAAQSDRYSTEIHDAVRRNGITTIVPRGTITTTEGLRAGADAAKRTIDRARFSDPIAYTSQWAIDKLAKGLQNLPSVNDPLGTSAIARQAQDAGIASPVKDRSVSSFLTNAINRSGELNNYNAITAANYRLHDYENQLKARESGDLAQKASLSGNFSSGSRYNANLYNDKDYDLVYEQINNSRRYQNWLNSTDGANGWVPNGNGGSYLEYRPEYSQLTEEEKSVYNYYYNQGDKEAANAYLEGIRSDLQRRRAETNVANYQAYGAEHPIAGTAGAVAMSPIGGLGAIPAAAEALFTGKVNPYASYNQILEMRQGLKGGAKETIVDDITKIYGKSAGEAAGFLYDAGTSWIESMTRAVTNAAIPGLGFAGLLSMSLEAGQAGMNEYAQNGASGSEALALGVINGLAEYITENMQMERITGFIKSGTPEAKKTIVTWFRDLVLNSIKESIPEAAEEAVSAMVDKTAEMMILGVDRSAWGKRVEELMSGENPMSREDAEKQATLEQWKEIGLEAAAGAVSGALGAQFGTNINYGISASIKGAESAMNRSADRIQRRADREAAKISGEVKNASAMSAEQWEASRKDQSAEAVRRRQTIRDTGERHGVSENTIRELQAASDRTGRNVAFTILPYSESASMNGVFDDDGNVLVNAKSNKPLHWILLHEFGHSIENSKEFNSLARLAVRHMYENGIDVEREIQKRAILYAKNGATNANPAYEMIMDWFGSNMGDSVKDIERLCNYDHGLGMRVWNYINEQLSRALGSGDQHQAAILNRAKEMYGRALSETAPSAKRAWNTTEEPEYVAPAAEETEQKTAPRERTPEEIDEEYINNIGDVIDEYASGRMTDEQYQAAIDELEQKYGYKAEFAGDLAKAKRKDDAYQKEVDKAIDDYNENKIDQEGFNKAIDRLEEKYGYKATELRPRKAAETEQAPAAQEAPAKAEAPAEQAPAAKAETKTEEKAPAKRQITPQAGPPTAEMKMAKSSEPESYRQERASLGEQLRNGDIDAEEYGDRTDRLDDEYGRDVVADAEDAAAAYNVDENGERQYSYTAHEDGIDISNDTKSAYKYSYTTWNKSDYVQKRDEAAEELAENVLGEATDENIAIAKKWIDDVNGIASVIANDRTRLDYVASPGRSSFKSNAEYGGSIDSSTICAKRRLLTGTIDAIQTALGDEVLSEEDYLAIRDMMKREGHEVSCGLCYVESTRKNIAKYASQFLDEWNAGHPDDILHMTDVNTVFGLEDTRLNNPEAYDAYVAFMNKLAQRKPKLFEMRAEYNNDILKKFKNDDSVEAKNHNGGLRINSFSDFEIVHLIDMMQVITDMANVGLNGQAYTKVREFAEALGGTGLKINMSMICGGVDENGRIIFDEVEGMKWSDVEDLRDKYPDNVGTILVTFTDEQLKAALNDDRIDYIIPFHRSQWSKKDYALLGIPANAKDATPQQNERYIEPVYRINKNGKPVKMRPDNYMPNNYWRFDLSGKKNAENYLRMCAENNRRPKFYKLLVNNGDGSYSLQPDGSTDGYWKLLIDFKMYNHLTGEGAEQKPVRPIFDMEACQRMLNNYKGGHQSFPVAQDIVDSFVNEYKGRGKAKYKNGKYTLEGGKFSYTSNVTPEENEEYLRAARAGDEKTAGRMVEEAANRAFPKSKVRSDDGRLKRMFHGTNANVEYTIFDIDKTKNGLYGKGFYFTDNAKIANEYTEKENGKKPRVYSAYLDIKNPLIMEDDADAAKWLMALPELRDYVWDEDSEELKVKTNHEFYRAAQKYFEDNGYDKEDFGWDMLELLENMGYDGINHIGGKFRKSSSVKHNVWIAFRPEQIKSADPITYDDDGNIIPLDERFNPEEEDIRYSITQNVTPEENERYMEYANAGNENAAEAMLRKAAKRAGAATDERGQVIDLYHGTPRFGFDTFEMDTGTNSYGIIYTTTRSEVSANYGGGGRGNYAFVRKLGKGFKEYATDINDIIDNAYTVDDVKYQVLKDSDRNRYVQKLADRAEKIRERIDLRYPGKDVFKWDDDMSFETALDNINNIFYYLMPDNFRVNSSKGMDLDEDNLSDLHGILDTREEYIPEKGGVGYISQYDKWIKTVQDYLSEHRDEIKKTDKEFYDLYSGFDLTDEVANIRFQLLPMLDGGDLLVRNGEKVGTIDAHFIDPQKLQARMDENHNSGVYHLFGFLGDKPLIVDANAKSWFQLKAPEVMGDDREYTTDAIAHKAKDLGYTSVIVKNVYDGGMMADNYMFFDPSQVKSADPITYDKNGEIIPLNQRLNQNEKGLKYSYTENESQPEQDTKLRPMTAVEQADRRLRNAQFNARVSERQAAADNIRLTAAERREMFGSPNSIGKVNTYATAKVAEAEGRGKQIIANSRDVGRAYENVGRAKGAEHEREGRENKLKLERAGRENKKQLEKEGRAEKRRIIKEGAPALDQMAKEKYAKAKERGYAAGYESGTKKANREYTQLVKQYEREMIEAEDRENAHVQLWEKARNQEYKPIESAADAVDMYNALKAARRAYRRISDYNELTPHERMFVGRLLRDEEDAATLFREKDIRYLKVLSEATAVYNYSKLGSMLGEYRGMIHTEANKTALDAIGGSENFRKMRDVPQKLLASAMTTGRVFDYIAGNDYEMAERLKDAYVKPITRSNGAEERLKQRVKDRISALNIDKSIRKGNKVSEDYAVQFIGEKMSEIEALEDKESKWRKQHDSTISDIRSQLDGGVQKNGRPLTEKMRQNLEERLSNHESKEMPEYKNEAGQTLEELRAEVEAFKDANRNLDYNRIENDLVPVFREIYNDLFEKMNEARVANGYEPVDYRRGYFPHFTREDTSAMVRFAKSLGMEFDNKVLPTSIQGLTHEFRPGINWFSAAQERTGTNTDFSAQEGMDRYLEGVAKVIYRTENITKMRALANTIRRLADPKFDRFIKDVYSDKTKSEEEKYAAVEQKWRNELSDDKKAQRQALSYFVTWLDERTNIYAGKATNFDRLLRENLQVRTDKGLWKLLGFATDLPRGMVTRYGGNTVSINPGSWLTNFAPIFEVSAEVNPKYVLQALGSLKKDLREGFTEESNFLTARSGTDPLFTVADIGRTQMNHQGALKWLEGLDNVIKGAVNWSAKPMELIDGVTSYVVTRAYYLSNLDKGMSHDAALDLADNQAGDLMADRAPGKLPILMEIKNPIAKGFTQFQTEVLNSLEHNTHDVFGEIRKRYADDPKRGRAVIKSILRYMGFALRKSILLWLCNELYEALVGRRFMPDPIDWANEFRGDLTGNQLPNTVNLGINAGLAAASGGKVGRLPTAEDFMVKAEPGKAVANLGKNVAEELPIVGSMLGGGRIPVQQAVKDIDKLPKGIALLTDDDKENNAVGWRNLVKGLSGPLTYFVLPGGGTAVRRAVQAAEQYKEGGAFDVNGNLRYPLYNDNTLELVTNVAKVGLFGSTSSEAGQKWVDSGFDSFSKDATAAYIALTELGVDRRKAYGVVNKMRDVEKTDDESENTRKRAFIREQDIDGRAKAALYETMVLSDTAKARDVIDTLDIMGADMDKAMDLILGLADIDAKGYTVPDDSSKAAEKRKLLNSSRLDGDSKLEVYSNLILTSNAAKERDLISRVKEFCDDGELVKVLTGLKESGKTVDDTRVLVESSLPDDVKEEVYKTMCVNADQVEKKESQIDAFREAGMGFNEYITAANKYAEINAQEDLKPVQKATEFARWADDNLGSGSSAAKENLKYSSGFSVEASGYEKMTDTGLSSDKAYDLTNQIAALTPKEGKSSVSDVQKAQVVASQADLSEEEKLKALRAVYSDSENSTYSKAYVANMYGVPLEDYFKIVDKCLEVDADPKYKDYKAQERTAAVLNSFKSLTNKQRAAIWQVYNTGWVAKNNPYDSSVGAYVRSLYYEADGKTKKETLPGGLSRSGSSSASAELTPPKAAVPGGTSSYGSGQKVAYTPKLGVPRG